MPLENLSDHIAGNLPIDLDFSLEVIPERAKEHINAAGIFLWISLMKNQFSSQLL